MMQGWSAPPPTRPQSYSVACAEGHRLHGQRTEGYQALRCPTCGEGIFVLPRSPLPEPPAPASPVHSRASAIVDAYPEDDALVLTDPPPSMGSATEADLDEPEAEIDWVDEIPAEPAQAPSVPVETPQPKPTPPSPKASRPAAPAPRPKSQPKAVKPAIPVEPRPTLREWAMAHRNVLLSAGVILLIVGVVAMRRHRQRLEELPRIAEIGRAEGLKRLDAGEFHAAKKLLADADDAVKGLGGRYEGAEAIHQGALEAAIFADLAPAGLDEILEEAATIDPSKWASRFAAMYQGRSVILDPPIFEVPNPAKPGSPYQVDCPLYFGRGPSSESRGRIDLTGFRLFELAQPKVGEQKPFGARYASVALDLTTNQWVVTFEPESGVFITHDKALESINWSPSEASEEPGP